MNNFKSEGKAWKACFETSRDIDPMSTLRLYQTISMSHDVSTSHDVSAQAFPAFPFNFRALEWGRRLQ